MIDVNMSTTSTSDEPCNLSLNTSEYGNGYEQGRLTGDSRSEELREEEETGIQNVNVSINMRRSADRHKMSTRTQENMSIGKHDMEEDTAARNDPSVSIPASNEPFNLSMKVHSSNSGTQNYGDGNRFGLQSSDETINLSIQSQVSMNPLEKEAVKST